MSKKNKRRFDWKRALRKYACLPLLIPAGLVFDGRTRLWALTVGAGLCYLHIEAFHWRQDSRSTPAEKRVMALARFWRYGMPLICLALLPWGRRVFGLAMAGYGAYILLIALNMARHFVCGMQDIGHRHMKPGARPLPGGPAPGNADRYFLSGAGNGALRAGMSATQTETGGETHERHGTQHRSDGACGRGQNHALRGHAVSFRRHP